MRMVKIKHYVRSLVEIGHENDCFDELTADLSDVDEKINQNLDFKKYLLDKQVPLARKSKALKEIFQDFISQRTYNFILLLIKDGQLDYLSEILTQAGKMSLAHRQLVEVVAESALPLSPDEEDKIKKIIAEKLGRQTVLKNIVNASLLGGLRLRIGDMVIEGSVLGKIERLKQKIESIE